MRRLNVSAATIVASVALFFSLAAPAGARSGRPRIAPLRLTLTAGHAKTACTRRLPDSWNAAVWVHANGRDLHSAAATAWSMYYAGDGTLVRLRSYRNGGPVCARAITWLPHARIVVTFRVL